MIEEQQNACQKTIQRIRDILNLHNIFIDEKAWYQLDDCFFSVQLEMSDLKGISVNGKGITKEAALASAYGELMERLQSRMLIKNFYANKEKQGKQFSDEKLIRLDRINLDLYDKIDDIKTKEYIRKLIENKEKYRVSRMFLDVKTQKIEYISNNIIGILCGTNGLSAGNTFVEAAVRGLYEIIERYIHKLIFKNGLVLNTINERKVNIHDYHKVKQMFEKRGYKLLLKDCTLNNTYPVLGTLLINESDYSYKFAIGCDFDINVAFSKCITEMLQGFNFDNELTKFKMSKFKLIEEKGDKRWDPFSNSYYYEWIKSNINKKSSYPLTIFSDEESCSLDIFSENLSFEKCWSKLKKIIDEQGYNIYIADNSILSFPTVRVYVPGMSEMDVIHKEMFLYFMNYEFILNNLMNISESQYSDSKMFMDLMENIYKIKKFSFIGVLNIIPYIITEETNFFELDYNFYMGIYANAVGDQKKACEYFEKLLLEKENNIFVLLLYYLNKKDNINLRFMKNIVGKEIFDYFFHLNATNSLYKYFDFPTCPNCDYCPIDKKCKFIQWKRINDIIQKQSDTYHYNIQELCKL